MLNTISPLLLPFLLFFSYGLNQAVAPLNQTGPTGATGTLEKMIVAKGSATLDLDMNRLNGTTARPHKSALRFALVPDSFFTILVFNDELRGPVPSAMSLSPQQGAAMPASLQAAAQQLVIESTAWGGAYELIVRDGKTGFVFFNIEGHEYDYDAKEQLLSIKAGRLLLSEEFARALGRPAEAGVVVGSIAVSANMRAIEITQVVNGDVASDVLPAQRGAGNQPAAGNIPGPDVIVGDLSGLAQFDGSSGTQVGLSVATDSCNAGTVDLHWQASPANDHPVIPQNLYRMSGGTTNDERFEQIGQSSVKHAFTALTNNICGFGCNGVGGANLGSGCSDPYSASLNSGGSSHNLGSRAWINPFSGAYPRGDSATPPNSHTGHTHTGPTHRMLVEMSDLNTTLNAGATYYAEAQYITPHEYVWCQANPSQCNMYNNVSYRKYNVTGTGSPFSFATGGSTTMREKPAISAWPGAAAVQIEPAPGSDGIGTVAYKVTNPAPGVWHYEYAIYNQNIDRAIQSFSVPVAAGVNVSNIGFHAPPQHPGTANDGTVGSAGFSSTPWTPAQAAGALTWSSETFAQNPNANAIRWGTLYNVRFDADQPPQTATATIGFFKTGAPITISVQGPKAPVAANGISARAGNAAEPVAGTAPLLFTVALSTPAAATGVTVNYATANDTGGANPATGGAACSGTTDYINTNGTLNFAAGEQLKTVAVNICADTVTTEPTETLLLNLTGAVNAALLANQAVGTITQGSAAAAGGFLISELRTSGPGGLGDDFVELYNNTDTNLNVAASDTSAGYGVYKMGANCNATPVLVGTIANGTIIPARGHYLLVGSQYGLAATAAGDQTLTADIESDRNVAVFSTVDVGNLSTATRLDDVGFGANTGGGVCDLLREGTTLTAIGGSTSQYSLVRKLATGTPQDTNDNAADFDLVATDGGSYNGQQSQRGAPGPENAASPVQRNATIKASLIDNTQASSNPPNRVRDNTTGSGPTLFGTLDIRRKFTNNTGALVSALRFRVVDITTTGTLNPGGAQADLRLLSSTDTTANGGTITIRGTTLEAPSDTSNGGGLNSSIVVPIPGGALAVGNSINVRLLLGVAENGRFRFLINVEGLNAPVPAAQSKSGAHKPEGKQ